MSSFILRLFLIRCMPFLMVRMPIVFVCQAEKEAQKEEEEGMRQARAPCTII